MTPFPFPEFRLKPISFATLVVVATFAVAAQAQVTVADAWVRATVPVQRSSGAWLRLEASRPARLLSVSTPVASGAAIHRMSMQGGAMKMEEVDAIDLQPAKPLDFGAAGYHVMLSGLKRQLKAGETVPLTLVFADAAGKRSTRQVEARVMPIGTPASR